MATGAAASRSSSNSLQRVRRSYRALIKVYWHRYLDLFTIVVIAIPVLIKNIHRRSIRDVLYRQLMFTFVDGLLITVRLSFAVGVLLIVQTAMWIASVGGDIETTWPLVVRITIRDLAPLIASLVVIGRSASAIATELSIMRVEGEIDVIETQGIDPSSYLVMPRVVSTMIAVPLLTVVVLMSLFVSGFLVGTLMDVVRISPMAFADKVIRLIQIDDAWFFFPKTFLAGAFIGAIGCYDGLSVKASRTEIPRVATKAGVRSLTAVFLISAALSILLYGKILVFDLF